MIGDDYTSTLTTEVDVFRPRPKYLSLPPLYYWWTIIRWLPGASGGAHSAGRWCMLRGSGSDGGSSSTNNGGRYVVEISVPS
jgi:hypothetical protein